VLPTDAVITAHVQVTVTRSAAKLVVLCSQAWCSANTGAKTDVTLFENGRRFVGAVYDVAVTITSSGLGRGEHAAELAVQGIVSTTTVQRNLRIRHTVQVASVQVAYAGGDAVTAVGAESDSTLALQNSGNAPAQVTLTVQPPPSSLQRTYHRGYLWANVTGRGVLSSEATGAMALMLAPGANLIVHAVAPGRSMRPLPAGKYAATIRVTSNSDIIAPAGDSVLSAGATAVELLWRVRAASLYVYPDQARVIARSGTRVTLPTMLYALRSALPVTVQLDNSTTSSAWSAPLVMPGHVASSPWVIPVGAAPSLAYRVMRGSRRVLGTNATIAAGQWLGNTLLANSATPGSNTSRDQSTYQVAVLPRAVDVAQSYWLESSHVYAWNNWSITSSMQLQLELRDAGGYRTDAVESGHAVLATLYAAGVGNTRTAQPVAAQLESVPGHAGARTATLSAEQLGLHVLSVTVGDSAMPGVHNVHADALISVTPARCRADVEVPAANARSCVCKPGAGKLSSSGDTDCHTCPLGYVSSAAPGSEDRVCTQCPAGTFAKLGQVGDCTPCPEGALCTSGKLRVLPGYYLSQRINWHVPATVQLFACVQTEACQPPSANLLDAALSGIAPSQARLLQVASPATQCMEGATGPLCGSCTAEYAMSGQGCVECTSSTSSAVVLIVLVLLALLAGFGWLTRSLCRNLAGLWHEPLSSPIRQARRLSQPISIEHSGKSDTVPLIKVALNWLQVYAIVAGMPVTLPPGIRGSSESAGTFAELNPLSLSAVQCAMREEWTTQWMTSVATFACLLVVLPVGAGLVVKAWRQLHPARARAEHAPYSAVSVTAASAVMLYTLMFMPVFKLLAAPFDEYSVPVDGTWLLRSDTSVAISSSTMAGIRGVAGCLLCVWVGAVPVSLVVALVKSRNAVRQVTSFGMEDAAARYGTSWKISAVTTLVPMYNAYRLGGHALAYEVAVLLRKALLVLIPVLLPADGYAQLVCAALLFFLSAMLQTTMRPYLFVSVNRMELACLTLLAATMPALLSYTVRQSEDRLYIAQSVSVSAAQARQDDVQGNLGNMSRPEMVYWVLLVMAHAGVVLAFLYYLTRGALSKLSRTAAPVVPGASDLDVPKLRAAPEPIGAGLSIVPLSMSSVKDASTPRFGPLGRRFSEARRTSPAHYLGSTATDDDHMIAMPLDTATVLRLQQEEFP